MNCRVTTVEGLPSSTGINSSWQISQHSIIGVSLSGVAHQHARTPGISHNNIACISLETRRLLTQQTGAFRHRAKSEPKKKRTSSMYVLKQTHELVDRYDKGATQRDRLIDWRWTIAATAKEDYAASHRYSSTSPRRWSQVQQEQQSS